MAKIRIWNFPEFYELPQCEADASDHVFCLTYLRFGRGLNGEENGKIAWDVSTESFFEG